VTSGLEAALPELPPLIRRERIGLGRGFRRAQPGRPGTRRHPRLELFVRSVRANLVDSTVGLLCAPVAAATRRAVQTYDKSA